MDMPDPLPPPPPDCFTALFLDFDGTLVEIADRPDDVVVPPHLPRLLTALARRFDGRVAIVSGRALASLDAMLGDIDVPMAGSHGGELRMARGAAVVHTATPLPADLAAELRRFAQANGGLLVEPKPSSIAVHYRQHPAAYEHLVMEAERQAAARGMHLKHGRQVVELVMPGSDKGRAVEAIMAWPAFAGAVPAFAGDDITDEDAFRAIARMDGGVGILVGPLRPTAARWHLGSVGAVHAWLARALDREPCA